MHRLVQLRLFSTEAHVHIVAGASIVDLWYEFWRAYGCVVGIVCTAVCGCCGHPILILLSYSAGPGSFTHLDQWWAGLGLCRCADISKFFQLLQLSVSATTCLLRLLLL